MMKFIKKAPLTLVAAVVVVLAGAVFLARGSLPATVEGAGQSSTTVTTTSTAPSAAPSDVDLDAMVNACAKYMAQVPGAPSVTPGQMKDMMKGMMGSGGMMGR